MARQQYVSFDYDNFTESGLKKVTKEFEKNGLNVISVEADNKPKRQSGVQTKKAVFTFDDGQKVTLQVTAQGSVFQVRLNSRVIPVKNVDDLGKAIAEISDKVKANSKTFKKSLRKRDQRNKKDTPSPARTSTKKQLEAYQSQISELQDVNAELTKERDESQKAVQTKQSTKQTLESELEVERSRNAALTAELEQLQKEAA